jgi:hypothetical protein
MKSILTAFFTLLISTTLCNAQTSDKPKVNAISLELGKTGLIYNIVFDHRFKDKNFGFRVDIGSNFSRYLSLLTTGAGGYYLVGKRKSFLELGIDVNYLSVDEVSDDQRGITFVYPDYTVKTLYTSLNVGYRKYSNKNLFRIGISPGFIKEGFVPGGYISFGFTF